MKHETGCPGFRAGLGFDLGTIWLKTFGSKTVEHKSNAQISTVYFIVYVGSNIFEKIRSILGNVVLTCLVSYALMLSIKN